MTTKTGDKVIVKAYNPLTDKYEPTQVTVEEVSYLQGYETVRYKNPHTPSHWGTSWDRPIDPNEKAQTPRKGMTNGQLAAKYGISLETLRERYADWVENEGYTDDGKEHETFGAYLDYVYRLRVKNQEPFDGGRGAGSMGQEID